MRGEMYQPIVRAAQATFYFEAAVLRVERDKHHAATLANILAAHIARLAIVKGGLLGDLQPTDNRLW